MGGSRRVKGLLLGVLREHVAIEQEWGRPASAIEFTLREEKQLQIGARAVRRGAS
jgi:hypothetical protein